MSCLADYDWKPFYSPDHGNLVQGFYVPALSCAVRYDRSTGYFSASALALAMRGLEGLIVNNGHMRLLVGCTLNQEEVAAIEKGHNLRDTVQANLLRMPLVPPDPKAAEALELLAWMIAKGKLEVKVAVPCNASRLPIPGVGIYHAKAGIIEDKTGDRLAYNGSINETPAGWASNYESFHVYTSWEGTVKHVDAEEREFQALWADKSQHTLVIDVPTAQREQLLQFLPKDDKPARLKTKEPKPADVTHDPGESDGQPDPAPIEDERRLVWSFLRTAPSLPDGGERVGEATAAVTPWPHQVRAFERMYHHWPPRLLIADEVGLGKTIQAGMLLRQAWLSGRAKRILIMAPAAVLGQWQIELREKFNLNWPIYDGKKLNWCPSPAMGKKPFRTTTNTTWHHEPCIIVSSHLMRRSERARELLEGAEAWDLVILDEAHHARRRSGGLGTDDRPNQLLRLMRELRRKTKGLVLLTATPMQVSPAEVWDLLDLLGLPAEWSLDQFLKFYEVAAKPSPANQELQNLARLFKAVEVSFGQVSTEEAKQVTGLSSNLKAKKLLKALRDKSSIPLRHLDSDERRALLKLLRASTPVRRLISRHTRRLLRRYYETGKINTPIASREVIDRFVSLSDQEAKVYQAVEDYISTTYNNAAQERRTAVGFVMTIYRRRLASSFHALAKTLQTRLEALQGAPGPQFDSARLEEDLSDDETAEEIMDAKEAADLEAETLNQEEKGDIETLLRSVRRLPTDTKAGELLQAISAQREQGYDQVMVFTQYTDTLDFLRKYLVKESQLRVMCFSGRGGEVLSTDGNWTRITRDDTKERFRKKMADVLLCTDAAAEGLNFQFCGALINYDMPWNPMRVEQRIGRIDRVGQQHPVIKIVNLHYSDTVETDVYMALRERINLFETFVGALQPILSRLPRAIKDVALVNRESRERDTAALVDDLAREALESETTGFDIDAITEGDVEEKPRLAPLYGLQELDSILTQTSLLPLGDDAEPLGTKDFAYQRPGMDQQVRVTTDPDYFDQHSDSVELWSPGAPIFPTEPGLAADENVSLADFQRILKHLAVS